MTVREIERITDECVMIYVCDESGQVIGNIAEFEWTSELLDREVINISTYNYGIELDIEGSKEELCAL